MSRFTRCAAVARTAAAAATVTAMTLLVAPAPAGATTTITSERVTGISSTAFSVVVNSVGSGWHYRLFASTTKSNVYYANLSKATHSALSSTTSTRLDGLRYTTAVYWYRVQAISGTSTRTGPIQSVGLRPTNPTGVKMVTASGRLPYVTWSGVAATGAMIEQANDSAFTSGVLTYAINGNGRRYTPYLVSKAHLYYFRVRANNNGTLSGWSAGTSVLVLTSRQSATVMTYNVLTNAADGSTEGGNTVAPWTTSRRNAVAALIKQAAPDLVSIQEASGFVGSPAGFGGTRMVDDLVRALGGMYGLARTETPPTEHNYLRTGDYLLYKTSTYAPVGTGGFFTVGSYNGATKYAPYQIMRSVASGAQVLFVGTHTSDGGSSADTARADETQSMLSQSNSYNANNGNLPVIYAGDFNSHPAVGHVDGPGNVMAAAGIPDALDVAQARTNAKYNSANQYMNPPPATADNIDHIYVPAGIGVYSWTLVIHLVNGRFSGVIPSDHNALMTHVALPY